MKKYKLEIIVFLAGAICMGLEIVAARVLSPYVGSSNIVWTSIIGIILVSMSLGYWIGGKKADKNANINHLSFLLLLSAIATSLIPLFETIIVKGLAGKIENLTIAAILCAVVLFTLPCFILAMISPYAVKIRSEQTKNIGSLSGKISSLDTIGSIFGTFFTGFILIPNIGVSNINMGISLILIVMAIVTREEWNRKNIYQIIISIVIVLVLLFAGRKVFALSNPDIILDVDSEYSRIWVKEVTSGDKKYKTLQVDNVLESYTDTNTGEMGAHYLYYYDLFEYYHKNAKSTLLIGGAGYTYPMHYLNKYEDKTIDVVEIDSKMTEIAVEEFGLDIDNPRLTVYTQDGRSFLNYSKNKYDVIMIDAFKGANIPFELTTYEAMMNAYNMLNEDGLVITNIHSSLEGKNSKFLKYEYATYKEVFDEVMVYMVKTKDEYKLQNIILIGIKGNPEIDESKFEEYMYYLEMKVTKYESDKKIVTDDYAPIGT